MARYVESASQVTDQNMQELWGRILAGEIKSPGSFSLRALSIVSNLLEYEANLFEVFAKQTVRWKWYGFIPVLQYDDFLHSQGIGSGSVLVLADAGLVAEMPVTFNLLQPSEEFSAFFYGQNRMVYVRQKSPPLKVAQACWVLTRPGLELLGLIEREAEPKNMQLLVDIFRKFTLERQVGSYVLKDEGKSEFIPDTNGKTGVILA